MVSWLSMSDPNYGVVFQLLHKLKQTGHIVSIELNKSERMLRVIRLDICKPLFSVFTDRNFVDNFLQVVIYLALVANTVNNYSPL